jgi:hypothetical protein
MTLALSSSYPILDIFWTMLVAFGLAAFVWTLFVVFRDLFTRADLAWWGKTLWVLGLLVFPLFASLGYLISQSAAMAERRLAREGGAATQLRSDEYLHTVAGRGGYRGVRDTTFTSEAWVGPIRPV